MSDLREAAEALLAQRGEHHVVVRPDISLWHGHGGLCCCLMGQCRSTQCNLNAVMVELLDMAKLFDEAALPPAAAVSEAQDGRAMTAEVLAYMCSDDEALRAAFVEAVGDFAMKYSGDDHPVGVVATVNKPPSAAVREGERERLAVEAAVAVALNDAADQIEANARYETERYGTTSGVYAVVAKLRALAAPSLAAPEGTAEQQERGPSVPGSAEALDGYPG